MGRAERVGFRDRDLNAVLYLLTLRVLQGWCRDIGPLDLCLCVLRLHGLQGLGGLCG